MSKSRKIIILVVVLLALAALGWAIKSRIEAKRASVTASTRMAEPVIDLLPSDVATAQPLALVRSIPVSGGLRAVETAVIKAKVAAELRSLTVREGDRVSAGQLIGEFDTLELDLRLKQAELNAQAALAQLEIAQRNLENNQALLKQGFISDTALQTTRTSADAARASHLAAVAGVDLARKARSDARLIAPIAGLVSQRFAQAGERVALDARVLEIVDTARMELEAAVPPEEAASLRVGQPAQLSLEGVSSPVAARVSRINPSTQTGSRSVMAYLALSPVAGLDFRQGQFATGRIVVGQRQALVVPATTLRTEGKRTWVRLLHEGRIATREVRVGETGFAPWGDESEAAVEIIEGLREGEVVLRGGAGSPMDGQAARIVR